MRPSDKFEKRLKQLELDTSRHLDERILADAGDALETATELRRMVSRTRGWDIAFDIFKRGAMKVGMAAAVVITATTIWIIVEKMGGPCGVATSGNRNVGHVMPASKAAASMGAVTQLPADANAKKAGSNSRH